MIKYIYFIFSYEHEAASGVPEPPMDLDGLFLSQAFNNSSQSHFSLTQLSSSQIAPNKRRPSGTKTLHKQFEYILEIT